MSTIVPETDHVSRLCTAMHVRDDGSIAPTAFKLRATEQFLSVNWIEHLGLPMDDALVEIRRVMCLKLKFVPKARLAIVNVGRARDAVRQGNEHAIEVRHEPEAGPPADPSHSGIYGLSAADEAAPERIAEVVSNVTAARTA